MDSFPERGESRRTLLADAAIHILGTQGSRGLTHRAVDGYLGLPEGSASNYFRTRQALLEAAFERICEIDQAMIERAIRAAQRLEPGTASAAEILKRSLERSFLDHTQLERQRARQEISLVSSQDPDLNSTVRRFRQDFRHHFAQILVNLEIDLPDAAIQVLIGFADGMILDRIIGGSLEPLPGELYRCAFLALIDGLLNVEYGSIS